MSIDVTNERLITITEASQRVPGRPGVSTVWRWISAGCRGVVLESVLIGGKRYTSQEAIERFIAATTAQAKGEQPPVRTARQRERAIAAAERELRELGI